MKRSSAADFFDTREDEEDDAQSSDDEEPQKFSKRALDSDDDDEVDEEDEEDEAGRTASFMKRPLDDVEGSDEDDLDEEPEEPEGKLKVLSKEELEEKERALKKTGVVYISRVPPFMKPEKMRHILQQFGEVDRIFLAPEDPTVRKRRIKYGGNKKKMFTEGWAEFKKKKHAKLAAETLNGQILGGKKGNFYHDDIINVKYLHKFKWSDLTEQITREAQSRQEKLRAEIAQATRETKSFIDNVERQKMIKGIQEKRGTKDDTIRRTFDQRKTTTKRTNPNKKAKTDAKVSNVLGKIF